MGKERERERERESERKVGVFQMIHSFFIRKKQQKNNIHF